MYSKPKLKPIYSNNKNAVATVDSSLINSENTQTADGSISMSTQIGTGNLFEALYHQIIQLLQAKDKTPTTALWLTTSSNHVAGSS